MNAPAWPKSTRLVVGDLPVLLRFAVNPGQWRLFLTVLLLLGLYFAGLFIPIPGTVRPAPIRGENWWFVTLLDFLLTGGALSRGCIFSMGLLAPALLGGRSRAGRELPAIVMWSTLGLGTGAVLIAAMMRARGIVSARPLSFVEATLWIAAGGIALKMINTRLIRYRGPSPFYLNLSVSLGVSLHSGLAELLAKHQYTSLAVFASTLVFIAISAVFVLRSTVHIDVESIRSAFSRSSATLEIAAIDEALLDCIGALCLIFYLGIGGCLSLALGWHSLTPANYPAFLGVSILVFALVWSTFSFVIRFGGVQQIVNVSSVFGLADPQGYALRMLNDFWIIPGHRAGPETEEYIARKLSAATRRSFLLLGSWVIVVLIAQYSVSRNGQSVVLFPYGPLVFVFSLLMLIGNASMIVRHLGASLSHFRQVLRGQSRVLVGTYPLGAANKATRLNMDADIREYWKEEKMSEQLADLIDWVKMARQMDVLRQRSGSRPPAIRVRIMKWTANLVAGLVVSFVAGAGCLFFFPGISPRDLGIVILPLVVSPFVAPDSILQLLKKIGGRRGHR